jgi:Family of unknown function (DUF6166)
MKVYRGIPEGGDYENVGAVRIIVDDVDTGALSPRFDLRNHSPTGFAWSYYGSGPAQLALALLADAGEDDELAARLYQDYKGEVVAKLKRGPWEIEAETIRQWIEQARTRP